MENVLPGGAPVHQRMSLRNGLFSTKSTHESHELSLNATGYRLGLLVNFGAHGKLEWESIVR